MNEFKLRTSGVGSDLSQPLPKLEIVKDYNTALVYECLALNYDNPSLKDTCRPSHFPNYLLEKTNIKPKEAFVGPCLIRSTLLQSNKLVSSKYVTSFNIVTSSVCDVFNM